MINKSPFMELALVEAKKAAERGEVPIGAVIVKSATKEVISQAGNMSEELSDPTAHAEIIAVREACRKLGQGRLNDCDMYVTLEPCPMCAQAISFARIKSLYYGAEDKKGGGIDNGPKIFSSTSCHHKPDVYSGIHASESALILKDFFKERR